ncbi:MAG: chemotaxis protein CheW, partial [Methylobacter sp.]
MLKEFENEPYDSGDKINMDNLEQYLSFALGDEEYGVEILRVQEIRSWEPVSRIPNVPSYEKGVVNL